MRGVTCVFVVVALGVMANLRVCLCQFGFWAYMRFRCCCAWRDSNLRVCLLCQFSLWAFMQPCSFVARCILSVVVALQAIILMTRTFTCWMRVCCRTFESSCKFKSERSFILSCAMWWKGIAGFLCSSVPGIVGFLSSSCFCFWFFKCFPFMKRQCFFSFNNRWWPLR